MGQKEGSPWGGDAPSQPGGLECPTNAELGERTQKVLRCKAVEEPRAEDVSVL